MDDPKQLPLTHDTAPAQPKSAAQKMREYRARQKARRADNPQLDTALRALKREQMRNYRASDKVQAERAAKRAHREDAREAQRQTQYTAKKSRQCAARAAVAWNFVAFDGEAVSFPAEMTQRSDDHGTVTFIPKRYILLATSTGDTLRMDQGIATHAACMFLFDVKASQPKTKTRFVGYFCNYDINHLLRDVPRDKLAQLWTLHRATVEFPAQRFVTHDGPYDCPRTRYTFDWIPTKRFRITARIWKSWLADDGTIDSGWSSKRTVTLEDTAGFYQKSFLRAIEDWRVGSPDDLALIDRNKARRDRFTIDDIDEITQYNAAECRLLRDLTNKLAATLDAAGIPVSDWIGAGAVGGSLLRKHNVAAHAGRDQLPTGAKDAALYAYFGGRVQNVRTGIFPTVYQYDLKSAYPAAAQHLPALTGMWEHVSGKRCYRPDAPWSVWKVEYIYDNDTPRVTPFPLRTHTGAIAYPKSGLGWYWQPEVTAARECGPRPVVWRISEGWIYHPTNDVHPFGFIPAVYAQREAYKARGEDQEKVLKLGMNSVYGKLAQNVSYSHNRDTQPTPPPFQSFVWAGLITSITRATVYRAAMQHPAATVGFATDAVYTTHPLDVDESPGLGHWESKTLHDAFMVKPGVLHTFDAGQITRARGFKAREVPPEKWQELRTQWEEADGLAKLAVHVDIPAERFIGLGAVHGFGPKWWPAWGQFSDVTIHLRPLQGDRATPEVDGPQTIAYAPKDYPELTRLPISARYTPLTDGYTVGSDDPTVTADRDSLNDAMIPDAISDEQPDRIDDYAADD